MSSAMVFTITAEEEAELLAAVQDMRMAQYVVFAAFVAILYDIFLTLSEECELIWTSKQPIPKMLYAFARYPAIIDGLLWLIWVTDLSAPVTFCSFELYLSLWDNVTFLVPLQIIVIQRTKALWSGSWKVISILLLTVVATDSVIIYTIARLTQTITISPPSFNLSTPMGCTNYFTFRGNSTVTLPAWVSLIVFDTVVFLLTLFRALYHYRGCHSHLMTVLIRDGFLYYCILLALGIANLLLNLLTISSVSDRLSFLCTPVLRASFSIIGSRIMLNLRRAASSPTHTDFTSDSLSA